MGFRVDSVRFSGFSMDISKYAGAVSTLSKSNRNRDHIFSAEDVGGSVQVATDRFVEAMYPTDRDQANRLRNLVIIVNTADQITTSIIGARVAPSNSKAVGASPSRSLCSLGRFPRETQDPEYHGLARG